MLILIPPRTLMKITFPKRILRQDLFWLPGLENLRNPSITMSRRDSVKKKSLEIFYRCVVFHSANSDVVFIIPDSWCCFDYSWSCRLVMPLLFWIQQGGRKRTSPQGFQAPCEECVIKLWRGHQQSLSEYTKTSIGKHKDAFDALLSREPEDFFFLKVRGSWVAHPKH